MLQKIHIYICIFITKEELVEERMKEEEEDADDDTLLQIKNYTGLLTENKGMLYTES